MVLILLVCQGGVSSRSPLSRRIQDELVFPESSNSIIPEVNYFLLTNRKTNIKFSFVTLKCVHPSDTEGFPVLSDTQYKDAHGLASRLFIIS